MLLANDFSVHNILSDILRRKKFFNQLSETLFLHISLLPVASKRLLEKAKYFAKFLSGTFWCNQDSLSRSSTIMVKDRYHLALFQWTHDLK